MFARLILALLLAAFAFPAAAPAACHDGNGAKATAMSHAMPMPEHQDRKATPPHGCIGCVPPSTWTASWIADVLPIGAPLLIERAHVLAVGATPVPDTPPPRIA